MNQNNYTFITGETFSIRADSLDEAEQIAQHWDSSSRVEIGETMTAIYSMELADGDQVNQLHYTLEQLQACYNTSDLIKMLKATLKDGYTGLSLGLIIDLIKRDCERVA
jgi:hypothetical protein